MVDGQQVLARVRAKNVPDGWRVVRARAWRFVVSGAVLLLGYITLINDLADKASIASLILPIPSLTWNVPTGSGFLLTFTVLTLVAIFLIWQYTRQRGRVLVLLPDGFVHGDLRTGQVLDHMAYAEMDTLALLERAPGQRQLIQHVVLNLTDRQHHNLLWSIEDYYQLPPAEIAQIILTEGVRANSFHGPLPEEPSPQRVVEIVEVNMAPKDWKVFTPNRPITTFVVPLVLLGVLLYSYSIVIGSYLTNGQTILRRLNDSRTFGEVLAGELFAWGILILFTWGLLYVEFLFWRRVRQTRNR